MNCNVAVGTKVGGRVLNKIQAAKERIWILCPYISPFIYEKLKEASERGVNVSVITSNENKGYEKGLPFLIEQKIITNEDKLSRVKNALRISAVLLVSLGLALPAMIILMPEFVHDSPAALLVLLLLFIGLFIYRSKMKKVTVRTYSYNTSFPMAVMKSPNVQELTFSTFFAHSKVVIADNSAFVGSFNLTANGLFRNHEVVVELTDLEQIEYLGKELASLPGNTDIEFMTAEELGRMAYIEHPTI